MRTREHNKKIIRGREHEKKKAWEKEHAKESIWDSRKRERMRIRESVKKREN